MLQDMYRQQQGSNSQVWTTGMPRQTDHTQTFYPPVDVDFMKAASGTPVPGSARPRGFPASKEKPYKFQVGTAAMMASNCPSAEEVYGSNLENMQYRRVTGMVPTLHGIGSVYELDSDHCKSEAECRDEMRRIIRNQYKIVGIVGETKDYEPQIAGDVMAEGPEHVNVFRGEVIVLNNGDETLVTGDTAVFDAPVRPTRFVHEGDEYAQVLQLRKMDAVGYASQWVSQQLGAIRRQNAAGGAGGMLEAGPAGNLEEFQDRALCFPMTFVAGFLESVLHDAASPLWAAIATVTAGGPLEDFRREWLQHMVSLHETRGEDETKYAEITKHMAQAMSVGCQHPSDRLANARGGDELETRAKYTMAYKRQLLGGIQYLVDLSHTLMPSHLLMMQHVEPGKFGLALFVEN